jgi:hypothetical protein
MQRLPVAVFVCLFASGLFTSGCGSDSPSQPSPPPPPPGPAIALAGPVEFGEVILGRVATRPLTIRNTGTRDLKISAINVPAAFSVDFQTWREGTIAPNASANVNVYFVPDAPRSFSGAVSVAADHTSGTNTVAISGTGVAAGLTGDRISDPEVVQNILEHNQDDTRGGKRGGVISRWELPVPVYLAPNIDQQYAIEALDYLEANAGISYVLVGSGADPRVTVTAGPVETGRAVTNQVFSNNRLRRGTVTIPTHMVPCPNAEGCMNLYRHEFMHVLGIFGHPTYPPYPPSVPSPYPLKEMAVLKALYALPHGAQVNGDGTWQVVLK